MTSLFAEPPAAVCILRLSALSDTCHTLPVIRTLQQEWPNATFTWIIGKAEAKLLGAIPDVEFVVVDGASGLAASRAVKRRLRGRQFDVLLHMDPSLRANAIAMAISARVKLGFDVPRARGLQWLFTTHRVEQAKQQHIVDGFFGFAERLGVRERLLRWDIPVSDASRNSAQQLIPDGQPAIVIHPCSHQRLRNWRPEYYAQAADYAATAYGMRIVLCGGRGALEKRMGDHIATQMRQPCVNAIGKSEPEELLAILERAALLLAPDCDAVHLATAVGIPVLGLYAASNSLHNGPYLSRQLCIDKYDAAARALLGRPATELPWATLIDREGIMDLITPDDVIKKLQSFMTQRSRRR